MNDPMHGLVTVPLPQWEALNETNHMMRGSLSWMPVETMPVNARVQVWVASHNASMVVEYDEDDCQHYLYGTEISLTDILDEYDISHWAVPLPSPATMPGVN